MVEEETLKKAAIGLGTGVVSGVVAGPLVATVAVGSILASKFFMPISTISKISSFLICSNVPICWSV